MASGQAALCKCAVILELKELSAIWLSPELLLALEACLLNIYSMLRPIPGDYEQRAVLIRTFNLLAKDALGTHEGFPVVEAFGSFTMDLFTAGSDLDLSINFSNDYTTGFPRDKKISVLRKFTRFLYKLQRKGLISQILPILKARVPVVKVVDSGTGIECDVSTENKDGISRSSIFTVVSSIDGRFQILSYLMKAWAKFHDINSSKDRTMNSLSIIALVAFHLQTRDPPILPPFSALLKDGTDVSSIQKKVVAFKHFGRRNEESIAKLFITLLIKLSAVESLWPQGLCASTLEGSWIKKEWETGIGIMSIEDFLDPSQNFARSVGQAEMKKIYNCIKGSLQHLSRFMKGEIEDKKLREHLFGSFALNDSSDQITSEQMGLKRPIPFHEPDQVNLMAAKRARYTKVTEEPQYTKGTEEPQHNFHSTSTSWRNPSIPVNIHAPFQTSRLEDHINPPERSHSGHGQQYQPEVPVPHPASWPNPSLPLNPPALLQFSHGENQINRFDPSQPSHELHYQPQPLISPHLGYNLQYHSQRPISSPSVYSSQIQWQPPTASNPTSYRSDYYLGYRYSQDPFKPQSSLGVQHHENPLVPHQFSCILGHRQPDQHLQLPGIMDGRRENPWLRYSAQDLGVGKDMFVPPQQFNGPNYGFPPLPNL